MKKLPKPAPPAIPSAAEAAGSAPQPGPLARLIESLQGAQPINAEPKVMRNLQDATQGAPNAWLRQGTQRQDSTLFLRGIGGSVSNPYVTTYLDGVPQLHGYSANVELLDIEDVSLLAGPQGTGLPRNSLGGALWITSRRPSLTNFQGELESTYGSYNLYDFRGRISTPLIRDQLGFSFAGGHQERDGFSENPATGHDLDSRSANFGKAQFLWTPDPALEVRLIIAGESARDGDDALNDLDQLRRHSHQGSARDLEGYSHRDVLQPTLQITYHGGLFDLTSITGYTWWETDRLVDFDREAEFPLGYVYPLGPGPMIRVRIDRTDTSFLTGRSQDEQRTFTQEFKLSNPADAPVILSDSIKLNWQAGAFFHHTEYDQHTHVHQAEATLSSPPPGTFNPVPALDIPTDLSVETTGMGAYLRSTISFRDRLHFSTGLRWDYEQQRMEGSKLFYGVGIIGGLVVIPLDPALIPDSESHVESFTPEAALSFDLTPDLLTYVSFTGGRQPQTTYHVPWWEDSHHDYDQARSWNYEWGLQGRALKSRAHYSLALFYTDLRNIQVDVYDPDRTIDRYSNNLTNGEHADASAYGLETKLDWSPLPCWQLYGQASLTQATYRRGSRWTNDDYEPKPSISGHQLPYSPDYSATAGTLFTWRLPHGLSLYTGAEVQFIGPYHFDSINGETQDAYNLVNFRLGIRRQNWFAEVFAHNAFDTDYVASAYRGSDVTFGSDDYYLGESGPPATFGLRVGVRF